MLAMGSRRAAAFFRPVFNSLNRPSMFQCSAPAVLTGPLGKRCSSSRMILPLVERAEHEASAVRTEVAGEIMCGHSENYRRSLRRTRTVSKGLEIRLAP